MIVLELINELSKMNPNSEVLLPGRGGSQSVSDVFAIAAALADQKNGINAERVLLSTRPKWKE